MLRMWLVKICLDVYARATSVAHGHHRTQRGIVNNQRRCAHEVIRGLQVFFEVLVIKIMSFAEHHHGR